MSSEYPQRLENNGVRPSGEPEVPERSSSSVAGPEEGHAGHSTPPVSSFEAPAGVATQTEVSGQSASEGSASDSEAKKRRILIGSQRDPSLFSQYKPKPALAVPAAGVGRPGPGRRHKRKRPAPAQQSAPTIPRPTSEAAGTAKPASEIQSQPLAGGAGGISSSAQTASFPALTVQPAAPPAAASLAGEAIGLGPQAVPPSGQTGSTESVDSSSLLPEGFGPPPTTEPSVAKSVQAPPPPAGSPTAPTVQIASGEALASAAAVGQPVPSASLPTEPAPQPMPEAPVSSAGQAQKESEFLEPSDQPEEVSVEASGQSTPPASWEMAPKQKYPVPSLRSQLPEDLAAEFQEALADTPVEQLLVETAASAQTPLLEPESRHQARIVRIHRDQVFVELGGREQGVVPLKQFLQPPEVGQSIEVIVQRFVPEEGLYELTLPASAALVAEWSQLAEGMTVEARVTGFNTGGLECEVGHIRAFIPISMVDLYRVQDLAGYVGQKFLCKVIECNPQRANLVLSRRAVLEQQRQEARQQLLSSLAPGQIREGTVRKLMPFGAFVDLGHGVDGLLPISQISWRRINHPSEVLQEGQQVQVVVDKVDPASGRISLSLRQLQEDPWLRAPEKYPPNTMLRGIVRRVKDYGAFVELEPGLEGLVHISELSHKRVWRTRDVVQEGQEVDVVVLSVDPAQRRISLSIRQALPPEPPSTEQPTEEKPLTEAKSPAEPTEGELASAGPAPSETPPADARPAPPPPSAKKTTEKKPLKLKGGLGPSPRRGKLFGLKW